MTITCVRLAPPTPTKLRDEFDVDNVALEIDERGNLIDFRLALGRGMETLWLLPIEPQSYLRLLHINWLTCDDDPYVIDDPCSVDFGPFEWRGDFAPVIDRGYHCTFVRVAMTASPARYSCEATIRGPDGLSRDFVLRYAAD